MKLMLASLFPFIDAPKDLISKLLVVDPKKRVTVDQALQHEFFQVLVSDIKAYCCFFFLGPCPQMLTN